MSALVIDEIEQLLSRYSFVITSDGSAENLTCSSCLKLTVNPYQTHCGCIYCQECVALNLHVVDKYCNGGKKECKEEIILMDRNMFRTAFHNRKILQLKVHCPNELCQCISELINMPEHLRICTKRSQKCPFWKIGCVEDDFSMGIMNAHLNNNSFVHSELLLDLVENMRNEIIGIKEELRMNDREKEEMNERMNEINERMNLEREEFSKINTENKAKIYMLEEQMMKQENNFQAERDSLAEIMVENKSNIYLMEERMKKEIKSLKGDILEQVETERKEHIERMADQKATIEDSESAGSAMRDVWTRIDQLTETIDVVRTRVDLTMVGRATFLVEGFSTRRTFNDEILSPHFYSHTNGYKMRLQVHPGGCGYCRGTYLSVGIQFCKGEYDDLLEWPCRHAADFSVVNQTSGQPHDTPSTRTYSTAPDAYKYCYDKPIKGDNRGHGYHKFISHTDLERTPGLVVKDAVLLLCVISAPP